MADGTWCLDFFAEGYLTIYTLGMTVDRTERETQYVIERPRLPSGSAILNPCCGHGRHSMALAEPGLSD